MPDFLCHTLFARQARDRMGPLGERTGQQEPLFLFGAQGPDPFFYASVLRPARGRDWHGLGGQLHREQTDRFLEEGLQFLVDTGGRENPAFLAYYLGLVCHYVLDSQCHPYIYAFSGYRFNGERPSFRMSYNHLALEALLDVLVWSRATGGDPRRERRWEVLPRVPDPSVGTFWSGVLPKLYGTGPVAPGAMEGILRDLQRGLRFLHDPLGWKETLFRGLGRLRGRPVLPGKPLYPADRRIRTGVDYANETRRPWEDPMQPGTVYRDSFADRMSQARERIPGYCREIGAVLDGRRGPQGIFEGHCYHTNLRWDSPENRRPAEGAGLLDGFL